MQVYLARQTCFTMEDSSMLIQWAMNTLLDEPPAPIVYAAEKTVMDHDACPPLPNSAWHAPTGGSNLPVTWMNFSTPETSTTTTTQGLLPQPAAYGSLPPPPPPVRRAAGIKSTGSTSPATYAQEHIMAERKRREKISQRFVELSAVIPNLKKMDKATILSDATRYVKELQEKLNAWEAGISGVIIRSSKTIMAAAAATGKPLPEIEVQFCGNNVMVRVLCENGKGVVARVLAEVEDLHLRIVDANAIPSPICTLNITITAKVEAAFTVTTDEIIGRVSSALSQHSNCTLLCATKNECEN